MRPMLAAKTPEDLKILKFPLYAAPKLDGIRCLIDRVPVSRKYKLIPNRFIQEVLSHPNLQGLDGELCVGEPNATDCMRKTSSGVMSQSGEPDFTYQVFDRWDRGNISFESVINALREVNHSRVKVVPQRIIYNLNELEQVEKFYLDEGYEGLVLRSLSGPYKQGRSTHKEGYLVKLKRYTHAEGTVIGYHPLQRNYNEAALDNLGYTKRSKAAEGMVDYPLLGSLILKTKNPYNDELVVDFKVGTGWTLKEREDLWKVRDSLIGTIVTYKFFPKGTKERPREGVFCAFRSPDDL